MTVQEKAAVQQKQPEPVAAEHLRDQVFAAIGYAFAVAALVTGLLTPHLGKVGEVAGVALGVLLVPANVWVIRRCARLRDRDAARR